MKQASITLNNGLVMPMLGLGTSRIEDGEATVRAVTTALKLGYRLIDTAKMYGNEASVGKAVRESDVPREEIFITTKLWPSDFDDPLAGFEASLSRLSLEYVDLYLVHWPSPGMHPSVWQALEKIYEEKRARAIGVSNYSIEDIEATLVYARVVPVLNQVEFNPFDNNKELLEYCRSKHIALEAYRPLTRGAHLHDAAIAKIAKKYGKTPAQIMLRWCIEHGVVAIPKSSHEERLKENIDIFDFSLAENDMRTLDRLS